ncbi:MAG: halocarboxylic acid dehydrogenase DehI family protein [Terriglobia bacterium]|jgi:hypothetical protein|nr:halocarboxylic acid dehydrogenase DehI family protein [Terriglobia bacterium]
MPLDRLYEESEVSPEAAQIYGEIKAAFDLPYIPSLFKVLAGCPEYFRLAWKDLGPVAKSREFTASTNAMEEFIRSRAISGAWRLGEQEKLLAGQKVSTADMPVLAGVVGVFARGMPRMILFTRLLQRGFSGGQRGRITNGRQAPALSRLISLHIPGEKEAGLRTWLIYNDIKRTTGSPIVMDQFRVLTPFPGYLAAVWQDAKRVMAQPDFLRVKDEIARRSIGLTSGLPVRDHRELAKTIAPEQWRGIEAAVDTFARQLPSLALLTWVWRRSFVMPRGQAA